MGSEIVFELYKKSENGYMPKNKNKNTSETGYYTRVLFGGQTLASSNPSLGVMDMLPVETLLSYFEGLVGENASLIKGKCDGSLPL